MTQGWVDEGRVDLDGRTVAVRQGGDPEGRALVYFHGTPSSRLETTYADDLCAELGIRMISFDRPGYGDSAPAPFSLSSIAHDTGVLADALGVARFATVGQSGGGPFSLAAAAVLGDRVTRAGVTSGAGPIMQVAELTDLLDETDQAALALLPDREAAAVQFAAGFEPLRGLFNGSLSQITGGFRQMLNAHDGTLLDRPEFATCLVGAMHESMKNGASGGGWDNVSWVGPWDFDLASIRQPVHLWYGEEDTMCPPVAGTWLDEHLPTATLVLRAGEGHMGVMEHAREIFTTLVSD
jgi:pimeloyl-ACP methyl ester carboxylesterase